MIECGMVFLLMLLFSPNSSRAHFCIMYLPAFCVARWAVRDEQIVMRVLFAMAIVFSTLSIHIRLGSTLAGEQLMLWIGVVTLSAVSLLIGCAIAVQRHHQLNRELE